MPPTQTIRSGQVRSNLELGDSQVIDISNKVFAYDPPGSPLMNIITSRAGSAPAKNTTIRWMEDAPVPYWFKANTSYLAAATSIVTAESSAPIQVGDLLKVVATNEVIRVTANDTSTNTLTVVRGYMGTAGAIGSSGWLLNLRAAEGEGDTSPSALTTVKVLKTNHTQIVKTAAEMSRTLDEIDHYHGDERAYQRRKAAEAHARKWEEILLHGRKKEDLSGTRPIRACGGIDEFINTYRFAVNGTLAETDLHDFVGDIFRYSVNPGRKRKLMICAGEVSSQISAWGLNKLTINDKASAAYGMEVTSYVTPHGTLDIINHPLLEHGYAGTAYIIDPDGIKFRPLHSTELMTNVQENDRDGYKDLVITEASFQFAMEEAHGVLTGVTFADWSA